MARVAITGIGVLTGLGIGTEETWRGLVEGRSAVGPIRAFDASSLRTQLAAEIPDFDPEQFATRKALRSMTRNDMFAVAASALAARDAGLEAAAEPERAGLFTASNKETSNLDHILEAALVARNDDGTVDLRRLGEQATSIFYPLFYVEGLQAASLFYISQAYGLKGANAYFAGTGEAGAVAIGTAFRAVRRGEASLAIAGSFDDGCSWWNITKFEPLGILTDRNDLGAEACRPYDRERSGTVLGEGGAFFVLEDLDAAAGRGARIYAEVVGFGSSTDTHRLITPDPEGRALSHAVDSALREAGISAGDVGYIVADGTGTRFGDASEAAALNTTFGSANGASASSIKPATGHLVGGAGALNGAVAALALHHGVLPPTLNLRDPDVGFAFDWVRDEAREKPIDNALAISRGLEGQNVALVFRAP
jgi:3-oxoacyl-[acyl-carrier-protein] synthase II